MSKITENTIESFAIELFEKLGYEIVRASEIISSKTYFIASGGDLARKWTDLQISAMPLAPHIVVASQITGITADGQMFYSKYQQITYLCNI